LESIWPCNMLVVAFLSSTISRSLSHPQANPHVKAHTLLPFPISQTLKHSHQVTKHITFSSLFTFSLCPNYLCL
jgi:hypothetical protein